MTDSDAPLPTPVPPPLLTPSPVPLQGTPTQDTPPTTPTRVMTKVVRVSKVPVTVFLKTYTTEHAIYGTILVSALIAVGWNDDTDLDVLLFTVGAVGVFWIAHVYSGTIARLRDVDADARTALQALVDATRHSVGMILSMLAPAIFLLLATIGALDEYVAYYLALWIGVAVLAVLGYITSGKKGRRVSTRLLAAAATAALGLCIILLSSLVH